MHVWAVVLAAGGSSRLAAAGIETPKQFLPYQGVPLAWKSVQTCASVPAVRGVVMVFPAQWAGASEPLRAHDVVAECMRIFPVTVPVQIAFGGERRQDSVRNALAELPRECSHVLVHDAARPFASTALMARVVEALAAGHDAVIPGVPVIDTIKEVDAEEYVLATPLRDSLRAVQTPQGFLLHTIAAAHAKAQEHLWDVTDDAALVEHVGEGVFVVAGEVENKKITVLEDMHLLAFQNSSSIKADEWIPCTGFGYDVHRYGGERPFILAGVPLATDIKIAAHSDGDVVLHALMDAILGCLCLGDIGMHFPDTSAQFEGISSGILLAEVLEFASRRQLELLHVDITVVAQVPKVAPHRAAMVKSLSSLLQLPPSRVNVKATTEEHLGFTGEKKGIKAVTVVTGRRPARVNPVGEKNE